MKEFRCIVICGDILFIMWIAYNAIDEAGQGVGAVQAVALSSLVLLLIFNIILLYKK